MCVGVGVCVGAEVLWHSNTNATKIYPTPACPRQATISTEVPAMLEEEKQL